MGFAVGHMVCLQAWIQDAVLKWSKRGGGGQSGEASDGRMEDDHPLLLHGSPCSDGLALDVPLSPLQRKDVLASSKDVDGRPAALGSSQEVSELRGLGPTVAGC